MDHKYDDDDDDLPPPIITFDRQNACIGSDAIQRMLGKYNDEWNSDYSDEFLSSDDYTSDDYTFDDDDTNNFYYLNNNF